MNPTALSLILSGLGAGSIITMTSYHWLVAWIGLELNTLAIIPVIAKHHHPRSTEAATKYFLTQAAASALILFSSTMNAWHSGQWDITQLTYQPACITITMALAMKLGLAPLHFWLPEVLQGASMMTAMLITTWQKLAPMALIFMTSNHLSTMTLLTLGLASTMIGGWGGLNQTQLRKLMAFSSIANLGWMATISTIAPNIMLLNLAIYITMTMPVFIALIFSSSKTIKDLGNSWTTSMTSTTLMMLAIMSLGGLPPLTGFMPKWLILQEMINQHLAPMATAIAISALLSLFFYMRMTYTMTLTLPPNSINSKYNWRFKPTMKTTLISTTLMLALCLLPSTHLMT
uniref:NADH-ubiquinone oxidoreductase chain 2 n=1 Tax=Dibamus sp. TMT-2004a TaxID=302469 RepID=Q5EWZ7_9SAUR|nr:NADH dehydrogenase subunit 2 [Dibamus sp. TMT-2004a]